MPSVSTEFKSTAAGLLASVLCMIPVVGSAAASAHDEGAIRVVISNYEDALNARSPDQAVALYTDDAVMMPPYNQSVVGKAQLRKVYEAGSKMRALNLKFTVDEIVQISPEWAFVRTKSSGSSKVLSTGVTNAEANQELFILHKSDDGAWKIARYSFSNTNPPPHS
jgi:uncharacterized protein (TIGR02246 family)